MEIREAVRARRKNLGKTQGEVAEAAGISLRAYQAFESGETTPQPANMTAILQAVSMDTGGAEIAAETRAQWPTDVQVFLDMIGAYLASLDEDARLVAMRGIGGQIFTARG